MTAQKTVMQKPSISQTILQIDKHRSDAKLLVHSILRYPVGLPVVHVTKSRFFYPSARDGEKIIKLLNVK